jgi:hypothetical protein
MARPVRGAKLCDMRWFPIPEFRPKPRPQPPNRHLLAVDADPIPVPFGALLELVDENDMTGTPQFIKPYPDFRAGDSQRTFVLAPHGTTFTINGFNFRRVSRRNPLEFSRTTDRGVPSKFFGEPNH